MRMSLIGYGAFTYEVKSGERVEWPIIGLALQKNYITLYTSVVKDGALIVDRHKGLLGELRTGRNNFSFVTFEQLNPDVSRRATPRHRSDRPAGPARIGGVFDLPHSFVVSSGRPDAGLGEGEVARAFSEQRHGQGGS
jgi:hypothetical protein